MALNGIRWTGFRPYRIIAGILLILALTSVNPSLATQTIAKTPMGIGWSGVTINTDTTMRSPAQGGWRNVTVEQVDLFRCFLACSIAAAFIPPPEDIVFYLICSARCAG